VKLSTRTQEETLPMEMDGTGIYIIYIIYI